MRGSDSVEYWPLCKCGGLGANAYGVCSMEYKDGTGRHTKLTDLR